jgi:hypothetical protein
MNYQPRIYKEWVDETVSSVTEVAIRGNEVVISWKYKGLPQHGKATSRDGINFEGTWSDARHSGTSHDRGEFDFRLYPLISGDKLLLGRWWSEVDGAEREFLLMTEPKASSS